jgi:hypothetical protein
MSFYHIFISHDSGKCHVFMFTLFWVRQNPGGKFDPPLHNQQVNFSHVFAIKREKSKFTLFSQRKIWRINKHCDPLLVLPCVKADLYQFMYRD